MTSTIAFMVVIYYALVIDKIIVDCNVAFQLMPQPYKVNTYPIKGLLMSKYLA